MSSGSGWMSQGAVRKAIAWLNWSVALNIWRDYNSAHPVCDVESFPVKFDGIVGTGEGTSSSWASTNSSVSSSTLKLEDSGGLLGSRVSLGLRVLARFEMAEAK